MVPQRVRGGEDSARPPGVQEHPCTTGASHRRRRPHVRFGGALTRTVASMPDVHPDPVRSDEADLRACVEEVSAYLVAVRGGAPFLSPVDGRLLLAWLEQNVPVPLILSAIDEVAERHRRKRTRHRLTLAACKKTVEKQRTPAAGPNEGVRGGASAQTRVAAPGLARLAAEIRSLAMPAALADAGAELAAELEALAQQRAHVHSLGRAATAAVARFQVQAWQAASAEHDALRQQARDQLAGLRHGLRDADWQALVEEVAHDLIRQRTPVVCARQVWDRLAP